MDVGELIKRKPVKVTPDSSIREACIVMKKEGVGSLLVEDGGNPVGFFTERDVIRAVADGVGLDEKVSTVMTQGVVTIQANKDVSEAILLMNNEGIRHLVVVDDQGKVIGVISMREAAWALNSITLDSSVW
ncbi:CBS domain-containing protein [Sulfuracidifex metallicus]|uniref:CBS domain-containing protein n=1 Tax=Sulfuracidifex metallicus TaxID=47303 RepID=UPI002276CF31|nr:CBS domain-containing protein [Sulfuracidifex metallicus]MCY0850262.1 CBS domain-containing protein [Sulfuracidifex metallicus]